MLTFLMNWYIFCAFKPVGGIAQLGEHLICIQKVAGSIPVASTNFLFYYFDLILLTINRGEPLF